MACTAECNSLLALIFIFIVLGSLPASYAQARGVTKLCIRARVCNLVVSPTGYTVTTNKQGTETGITISTGRVNACSDQQLSEDKRAAGTCFCASQLSQWVRKAPSTVQAASVNAISQFTGLTNVVLQGMATSEECILKASKASAADVNRMNLIDSLVNTRSVKVLAGTSTYNYIRFPAVRLQDFSDFMSYTASCMAARSSWMPSDMATVSSATSVPQACVGAISWLSSYAEKTLPDLLALKTEVMQQFHDFLGMVENGLNVVEQSLDAILQPNAWEAFMHNASLAGELMEPPCLDVATCFGGVLAATWNKLKLSTPVVNEQTPAMATLSDVKQAVREYKAMTLGVLCNDEANVQDAERSYLSMYKAAVAAMLNVSSDLNVEVLMRHGPGILSRTLAEYAGLSLLQGLEVPAFALKDAVKLLADACADAVVVYNQRYMKGMYRIASVQTTLVSYMQGGVPSPYCPDGQVRQQCPINRCMPFPDGTPACPDGYFCVTDGCDKCEKACNLAPPTSADATAALQLLKTWLEILRGNEALTKAAQPIKDTMPGIANALDYLYAQGNSPGSRTYMYDFGLLTYKRRLSVPAALPCPQGTAQKCYRYKQWRACKVFQRPMGTCNVTEDFDLPNGYIPWLSVHAGLTSVMYNAFDLVSSYNAVGNLTINCSNRRG